MSANKISSKNCVLCDKPVSMLGAFAQVKLGALAHASCVESLAYERGYQAGRKAVLDEQGEAARAQAERAQQQARARYDAYPRCSRCGKRTGEPVGAYNFGELVQPSSVPGVCGPCVREEIKARAQATSQAVPAQEVKRDAPKEETTKRDRFQLLDID